MSGLSDNILIMFYNEVFDIWLRKSVKAKCIFLIEESEGFYVTSRSSIKDKEYEANSHSSEIKESVSTN